MKLPLSPIATLTVSELNAANVPLLQRFYGANPLYFLHTHGQPAQPNDAHDEIHELPPADMPFGRKLVIGYVGQDGELMAMVNVVTDFLVSKVWHIGMFIVATAEHGNGVAQTLYRSVEAWAHGNGAQWLRLGVVQGYARAERFWSRQGFMQTRTREGIHMGARVNTVQAMVKPLASGTLEEYLALVARDRPAV